MKTKLIGIVMILSMVPFLFTGCLKVVKIGEEAMLTGDVVFDAKANVAQLWESQILPDLEGKAVDLKEFLTESNGDLKVLADKYGKYSMGTSGELSYTVKGTGIVAEVNREKKAGYMEITLDGYSGKESIKLQIGDVYKGSAVRDSLSFIKFEDYNNQVDYAAVSQSIHQTIQEKVINVVDMESIQGQVIEFVGCFTVGKAEELVITPIVLTVK